jgi:hypothetical protein
MLAHAYRNFGLALLPKYICHLVLSRSFDVEAHGLAVRHNIRKVSDTGERLL